MGSRLNWNDRQSPTDFDNSAPQQAAPLDFDYTHAGGAEPWPARHSGIKFGPALIRRAWAGGLIVYAEIEGWPYPVAVREAQWTAGCLEVKTLDGPRIPLRLFTRPTVKGLTASGLLIE
jgi:hypothetical protein